MQKYFLKFCMGMDVKNIETFPNIFIGYIEIFLLNIIPLQLQPIFFSFKIIHFRLLFFQKHIYMKKNFHIIVSSFFQNHLFQAFLVSKTYIYMYM